MAISEQIEVGVSGLGEVDDLAGALDKAALSAGKLKDGLAELGGTSLDLSAAGPDKLVAAWDAGFARIKAGFDDLAGSAAKIGDIGAGAAGPDKLVASWSEGLASLRDEINETAAAGGKLGDLGAAAGESAGPVGDLGKALDDTAAGADRLGGASGPAADGIKGIGDSAKESEAFLAEYNATLAETAAMAREASAASADASAKIATSMRLQTTVAKGASDDAIASQAAQADASKQAAADAEASATKYHMLALGGAAALAYGVDKAAQLQTSVTRLYTTAGESAKNLPMMSAGILALSGQTNTSQSQLGQGAYMVESAGFHGQSALNVLKAAAEGAQSEGAPLGDTANALTSLLNAYGMKGSRAPMQAMDEIIAMVSRGKMTMSGAVGALPDVLPAASAAKLSFADVGGALSTMTSMGVSPDRAAQNLSHVITSIMNPSNVQTKEQQQLGLNPVQIQNDLGKQGLTGTLTELSGTVMKSMGPAGDVLFKTFNQSQSAAAAANKMIAAMPSSIRGLAQAYADGKTSAAQWNQEMFKGSESGLQKNMLQQFATTENQAKGFNDLLKSGSPDVQTYAAAMDKLLGGQTGLNVAMELTGQHMPVMRANTDAIASSAQHAGDNVTGWSKVLQTLNFQLGSFTKTSEAVATEAGQVLLPTVTTVMKGLADAGGFLASHPALTKPLVEGGAVLGAAAILPKVASAGATALGSIGKVAETLHIPGLDKLANAGKGSATAGMQSAADTNAKAAGTMQTAADTFSTAADKMSEPVPGGGPGGGPVKTSEQAGETGAEDTAEGAGAAGLLTKIFGKGSILATAQAASGTVMAGLLAGELIKGVGDQIAPKGSQAGKYNAALQKTPATNDSGMMPYIFGGFEGKLISSIGMSVGKALSAPNKAPDLEQSRYTGTEVRAPAPAAPLGKTPAGLQDITDIIGEAMASARAPAKTPAASETFTSALAQAMGKGVKVPPPDISSYRGEAQKAGQEFNTALGNALHKPVKVVPPDLSAYAAAKGPATADGLGVSVGFAQGIESGKGTVAQAAADVAAAAPAAMRVATQSRSPSKVTEKIGADTSAGLAKGITSGTSAVKASAVSLSASTITSLTEGLQGGTSAINSALQAISGKGAQPQDITTIAGTVSTLKGDIAKALAAGQIGKPEDSALVKIMAADDTKLQALSAQRAIIEEKITDSEQIAQQAISSADITSAGTYTPVLAASGGPLAASSTVTGMQQMAADQKQFQQVISQLGKSGLNATSLNQFVQAGSSSLPQALGLEQGGKGAISQVNAAEAQIIASAKKLGDAGAPAMYQAGVQSAEGFAEGLKSQLSSLDSSMSKLASTLVAAVKRDLKISSPSGVFRDLGFEIPAGVARGVDDGAVLASSAVGRMGSQVSGGFRPSMAYAGHGGGYGGGSVGGGTTIVNHYEVSVTVQGSVSAQNDLVNAVKKGLLKTGSNNWQTGIIRPGRAG